MIRRRFYKRFARKRTPLKLAKRRSTKNSLACPLWVERLEDRYLLSATTWQSDTAEVFDLGVMADNSSVATLSAGSNVVTQTPQLGVSPPPPPRQESLATGALLPQAPFPPEETFFLHSLPGATKVIYLDFDGHTTRDTQWNIDYGLPNIQTPAYDLDDDFSTFSDLERANIQGIWERVAEDFRPFNVDVTTEDPGVEALRNRDPNPSVLPTVSSVDVGQVIDNSLPAVNSTLNFISPLPSIVDVNVTLNISHTFVGDLTVSLISPEGTQIDLVVNVGGAGDDFLNTVLDDQAETAITAAGATPPYSGSYRPVEALGALNGENPSGVWRLVVRDDGVLDSGVLLGWSLTITAGNDAEWGQRVVIGGDSTNDWFTPVDGRLVGGVSYGSFTWDSDTPNFVFGGDFVGLSGPANIAEVISHETGHALGLAHDGQFRFYLNTDADPPELVKLYDEYYAGHGTGSMTWAPIMGVGYGIALTQWSKGEYFNATNNEEGTSPLQDDLAVITSINGFGYRPDDHGSTAPDASEVVPDLLTVDSDVSFFEAEGIIERNTDVDYFSFTVEGLGELVSLDIDPFQNGPNLDILAKVYDSAGTVIATSDSIDVLDASFIDLALLPGTYYVSIEGAGRPITFIDPTFHPGPYEAAGNPPEDPLPPDLSDWGYSDYGSLGYYSVKGSRKKNLVVGVDFDINGGMRPRNWNSYAGGSAPGVLTGLINEAGLSVPYELTVSSTGATINTVASASPITPSNLPQHGILLDKLAGYLTTTADTLTFEWSQLIPDTVYQIYVFGHASEAIQNHVTVIGGTWNGVQQVYDFVQDVSANGLVVNDSAPGTDDLTTYSLLVVSDLSGTIAINVQGANGAKVGVAGLAITTTKVGSLSGQKWEDVDGDRIHQPSEPGREGWLIYLDLNNDGILNSTIDRVVSASAPNVPQNLQDYSTVKNELFITEADVITDVNVTFDIDHTFDADLNLYLVSPAGTRVKLLGDLGGSGDNFRNTTLDDEAASSIASAAAPFTGSFRPQNALNVFDGEISAGKWTLEITDDATGDTGVLKSWSLSITFAGQLLEPNQLTDANGNYSFTNLRAGQYIVREQFSLDQIAEGWRQSLAPPPITVRSGAEVEGVEFGNWIPTVEHGAIEGVVFEDTNGNGAQEAGEAGLPGRTVYLDANGNGAFDDAAAPVVYNATGLPAQIEDFSVVNSPITVSSAGTVYQLEVTLDITHSFVGDLDAYLLSPSGRTVELFTQVGGQYNDLSNVTLSDSASRSIATLGLADVPYTGTWRPEGLLNDFIGDDLNGTWILQIRDTAFADEGTLNSWSLRISAGEASRVTDQDGAFEFADLPTGVQAVREVVPGGWAETAPNPTSIPGATWTGSQWSVTVAAQTSITDVNFGNQAAVSLPGDYDRTDVVDAADYVLWRKKLGTSVAAPYDGPDGNGNSVVDSGDYNVWRSGFGNSAPIGSGSVALVSAGSLEAPAGSSLASEDTGSTDAANAAFGVVTAEPGVVRTVGRPTYRPAVMAATTSDQALLAWLSETGEDDGSESVTVFDDALEGDVESVDSAFETLEVALAGIDGAV